MRRGAYAAVVGTAGLILGAVSLGWNIHAWRVEHGTRLTVQAWQDSTDRKVLIEVKNQSEYDIRVAEVVLEADNGTLLGLVTPIEEKLQEPYVLIPGVIPARGAGRAAVPNNHFPPEFWNRDGRVYVTLADSDRRYYSSWLEIPTGVGEDPSG